jgi:hypothetical protein
MNYFITLILCFLVSCHTKPNYSSITNEKNIHGAPGAIKVDIYPLTEIWSDILNLGMDDDSKYEIIETGGDGDCFFYSVATSLSSKLHEFFALTANKLREHVSTLVTDENFIQVAYQVRDAIKPDLPPEIDFIELLNSATEEPRGIDLLREIIKKMASEEGYHFRANINEQTQDFSLNYWGDRFVISELSKKYELIRFIVLKHNEPSIGESVTHSACVLKDTPHLEEKKFFNVILWWTGGHFQLVGKRTDEADGSAMIKGKKYKLLFENSELPVGLRSIYETQCRWEIPQD